MLNALKNILIFSALAVFCGGCSDRLKDALGVNNSSGPDEFSVIVHPPLVIPEDLDNLPKPQGAEDDAAPITKRHHQLDDVERKFIQDILG